MSLGNSRASNSIKGLFNTWDGEPSLLYNLPKVRAESNGELTPPQGLTDVEGAQVRDLQSVDSFRLLKSVLINAVLNSYP